MKKKLFFAVPVTLLLLLGVVGCKSKAVVEERAEFERQVEARLNEVGANIQTLNKKVENATEESKEKLNDMVENLEVQAEAARAKLQEFKVVGADAWQDARTEVDRAVERLEDSYHDVVARLP